jgi:hypothetical protein
MPLSHSICRHSISRAAPLISEDLKSDPELRDHPLVRDGLIAAYAGLPITVGEGRTLGNLCAIDPLPRPWTPEQVSALRALADEAGTIVLAQMQETDRQIANLLARTKPPGDKDSYPPSEWLAAATAHHLAQTDAYLDTLEGPGAGSPDATARERLARARAARAYGGLIRAIAHFDSRNTETEDAPTPQTGIVLRNRCADYIAADRARTTVNIASRQGSASFSEVQNSTLAAQSARDEMRLALRGYEDAHRT